KSLPKSGKGVYPNQVNTKDKLTKDNIKPFSSENSDESSDQPDPGPHETSTQCLHSSPSVSGGVVR
ncbi:hypothetical protein ACSLNK_29430, partial [Escherichia coli]